MKIFAKHILTVSLIVAFGLFSNLASAAQIYVVNNSDRNVLELSVGFANPGLLLPQWHTEHNIKAHSTRTWDDIVSKLDGSVDVSFSDLEDPSYVDSKLSCHHEFNAVDYYFVRVTVENTENNLGVECTYHFRN